MVCKMKLDQVHVLKQRKYSKTTYDQAAIVQREIFNRLIERLEYMLIKPEDVLNLGAASKYGEELLQELYPHAKIITIDILEYLSSENSVLPLPDHSQQLIVCNLLFHWVNDPQKLLQEIARVLDPKGVLLLTSMGVDTLKECREAFAQVDNFPHVHDFPDMHDVGDLMLQTGFVDPVVDVQTLTVNYKSVQQLFQDLRDTGSTNAHCDRPRGLMGKNQWNKMLAAYETMKNENSYPGTYEIIYGHAWGVRTQQKQNGETSISLSAIEKMLGSD